MAVTSSEKLIKQACKPKKGAPKAKYLDPIILSTQVPGGPIGDICASLAPRLREPNVDVVFKSLLVLHTMIRSGGTDEVLTFLAKADVLRLKSVGQGGFWEGYTAQATLTHYAHYLHSRITSYRELRHDVVRVQAESNRASASAYRTRDEGQKERARKLRSLSVERGLLKETRQVQKVIDALVKAEFYRDDLHDECTVLAFRMMVKDLLVLFQAGNEGIINLLEHYFEMNHKDATDALSLYKGFCSQTKKVVEYLKYARELNNVIDVPIPNLKHAPVSLVAALEEYIEDPNFEQNREEYKQNKGIADGRSSGGAQKTEPAKSSAPSQGASTSTPAASSSSAAASSSTSAPPTEQNQTIVDFFASIEENQPTMFNPQTNSPSTSHFEQHATYNPFSAMLQQQQQPMFPQATGFPPQQQMMMQQPTGFDPFGMPTQQQPQNPFPFQQQAQPQMLQPQMTGYNPFRQSMLAPQPTGFPPQQQSQQQAPLHAPSASAPAFDFLNHPPQSSSSNFPQSSSQPSFLAPQPTGFGQQSPLQPQPTGFHSSNPFARPSSTPLTTSHPNQNQANNGQQQQPLTAQPTGAGGISKNPFGQPPPPKVQVQPTGPSMNELSMFGQFGGMGLGSGGGGAGVTQSLGPNSARSGGGAGGGGDFGPSMVSGNGATSNNTFGGSMSSLASSFTSGFNAAARPSSAGPLSPSNQSLSPSQPQQQALQPQKTGFGGSSVQPFKPSSSFGASLLGSLPEGGAENGGAGGFGSGGGGPNPFRSSTLPFTSPSSSTPTASSATGVSSFFPSNSSNFSSTPSTALSSQPTGFASSPLSTTQQLTGLPNGQQQSSFGSSLFSGGGGGGLQPQMTGLPKPFVPTSSFGLSSFAAGGANGQQGGGGQGGQNGQQQQQGGGGDLFTF